MNKILVEFHIPAAGLAFDVYLPVHMYIGEILPLLAAAGTGTIFRERIAQTAMKYYAIWKAECVLM